MAKDNKIDLTFLKPSTELFSEQAKAIEEVSSDTRNIKIDDLLRYHNHTFKVLDNEDMNDLVNSIKDNGVLTPLLVRKSSEHDGKYEIISGHRRKFAAEKAGLKEVPCRIINADDTTADILMVDANYQRESVLPSEKAFSYRLKMKALKKQGKRTDLTDAVSQKTSVEKISDYTDDSVAKIQRYIRLTYLVPELLDLVDNEVLNVTPAVTISFLSDDDQKTVLKAIEENNLNISVKNAEAIRIASEAKGTKLTEELVCDIVKGKKEPKKPGRPKFDIKFFDSCVPDPIKKLKTPEKLRYTKRALEVYTAYIEEHPDELDDF